MLTELDIINSMLSAIGVNGLTSSDTSHPDYMDALNKLNLEIMNVNKLGFWYNTFYPTFAPNGDGEIILPASVLTIDPVDTSLCVAKRGNRLFDVTNRTFVFEAGTSIKVKMIENLGIADMPITALEYLHRRARYEFYLDKDGDENVLNRLERAKLETWSAFYSENLRNQDINALNSQSSLAMARGSGARSKRSQVSGTFR